MSAATELPPVVFIPEQARRGQSRAGRGGVRIGDSRSRSGAGPTVVCRPVAFSGREIGQGRVASPLRSDRPGSSETSSVRSYIAAPLTRPTAFPEPSVAPGRGARVVGPAPASIPVVDSRALVRTSAAPVFPVSGSEFRAGALHLTRRGRVVLASLALLAAAAFVWIGHLSAPADVHARPSLTSSTVVVHDGDTLWSIAGQVDPTRDPRAVVAQLKSLNHLGDTALTPGQALRVR